MILASLAAAAGGVGAGLFLQRISWHWSIRILVFAAATWAIAQLTFNLAANWVVANQTNVDGDAMQAASNAVGAVFYGSLNGIVSVVIITGAWLVGALIGATCDPKTRAKKSVGVVK